MLYDQSPSNIKHSPLLNLKSNKKGGGGGGGGSGVVQKQLPISMKENNYDQFFYDFI